MIELLSKGPEELKKALHNPDASKPKEKKM